MIVAFSTSSPMASVALLAEDGKILVARMREARMNASAACLAMLSAMLDGSEPEITAYLADLGPGSFTGVKVGVTLAKTMAMADGVLAGGLSAFDLIDPHALFVIPSRKGEYFWRTPDGSVRIIDHLPESYIGYGPDIEAPLYPEAQNFGKCLDLVRLAPPEHLNPKYLLEPSISTPNKAYPEARA